MSRKAVDMFMSAATDLENRCRTLRVAPPRRQTCLEREFLSYERDRTTEDQGNHELLERLTTDNCRRHAFSDRVILQGVLAIPLTP